LNRTSLSYLEEWKDRRTRRPLVIRGARQVGKSHLARQFAFQHFENLVELDFEQDRLAKTLFESRDPARIVRLLEVHSDSRILPGRTLLFLDEIQAAPEVIPALRYFHEQLPALHVVGAGSLLEFALADPGFSMPVGRIEYLHLGPMTFEEYLRGLGEQAVADWLEEVRLDEPVPEAIHERLLSSVRTFFITGGMPEAVAAFAATGSLREAEIIKQSILATYRDDFAKYGRRIDTDRIRRVFDRIPGLVGQKFKYVNVDPGDRSANIARALEMLTMARVAAPIVHSAANGIPLGGEVKRKHFKVLFLDVGLVSSVCAVQATELERARDPVQVNAGALAEQFVGQHLLYAGEPYATPQLHYWTRQKRNSAAEVDYVISLGREIVPVEVKAGKAGTLKSLHLFLQKKKRGLGLRICGRPPALKRARTSIAGMEARPYRLLSLPLYMVGQCHRLVEEALVEA